MFKKVKEAYEKIATSRAYVYTVGALDIVIGVAVIAARAYLSGIECCGETIVNGLNEAVNDFTQE